MAGSRVTVLRRHSDRHDTSVGANPSTPLLRQLVPERRQPDPACPTPTPSPLRPQGFAFLREERTGNREIVRVVSLSKEVATVDIFRSPVGEGVQSLEVPLSRLEALDALPAQTPVYVRVRDTWRLCRIRGEPITDANGRRYQVGIPHGDPMTVPEAEVHVRYPGPDDDPTHLLAAQVTETPRFAEAKRGVSDVVARQRAAFRGVTALAGANIEFHPHQLATADRVLSDPVQRYLLADEVGLGKTIEACIILRQYLLDEPSTADVLVLTPDHLQKQWRDELREKFGIADDPRVRVETFSRLASGSLPQPGMLVVDEAHRITDWTEDRQLPPYAHLRELAQAPRVLLLSGTPVLHHEAGFFAMLHLLDPLAYPRGGEQEFSTRFAHREAVVAHLRNIQPHVPAVFARQAARAVARTFPNDEQLADLIERLGQPDAADRARIVKEIRRYIIERYRLDRRILRTHRDHPIVRDLLPQRRGLELLPGVDDPTRLNAEEWLAGWRTRALAAGGSDALGPVFANFVAAALSHPVELAARFGLRRVELWHGAPPAFPDEHDWLVGAEASIQRAGPSARDRQMRVHLEQAEGRVIVFVDAPSIADQVADGLASLARPVLRLQDGSTSATDAFWASGRSILVCDRESEEGVNLQRGPADVFFYDFPLDAGRIEQRLGRVDRLSGQESLRFFGCQPAGLFEQGWFKLLVEHIRPFERSAAPLQYVLSEQLQELCGQLFHEGADIFGKFAARFDNPDSGLDSHWARIREVEALDTTDWDEDAERKFVEKARAARTARAEEQAEAAFNLWMSSIQFITRREGKARTWFGHERRATQGLRPTLSPVTDWLPALHACVDDKQSNPQYTEFGPYVFRRRDQQADDQLLHFSHPFVRHVVSMMERDDRSKSWAFWRLTELPGFCLPQVYLKFEFLAESSVMDDGGNAVPALRRRADAVFPPEHRAIWMQSDGSEINNEVAMEELAVDYDRHKGRDQPVLASHWSVLAKCLNIADWETRVLSLRQAAGQLFLMEPGFVACREKWARQCREQGERTAATLEARAALGTQSDRTVLAEATEHERRLAGRLAASIENPRVRVLSAGAVILCSRPMREFL